MGLFGRKKKNQEHQFNEPEVFSTREDTPFSSCKMFLYDISTEEEIEGDKAIAVGKEEAVAKLRALSRMDGSYIGFDFDGFPTIQFMWDAEGLLGLDIPVMDKGGSFTKNVTRDEAVKIVEATFLGKKPTSIDGIVFDEF